MKYELLMAALPSPEEGSLAERHASFLEALGQMDWMWDFSEGYPGLPNSNPWPSLGVTLSRYCRYNTPSAPRTVSAEVSYTFRGITEGGSIHDDSFILKFNPARLDYPRLISELANYIEPFSAYLLRIENMDFYGALRDAGEMQAVGRLVGFDSFPPVFYADKALCQRAFGQDPAELAERLKDQVERIERVHDGLLVIGSSQPHPLKEDLAYDRRLKAILL